MQASTTVQDLLARARHRVGCFALGFISTKRHIAQFDITDSEDKVAAKDILQRSTESLLAMCKDAHTPVIRNRVREESQGPLLCRFLVAAVQDETGHLVGALVAFNRPVDPEFTDSHARLATKFTRLFAKAVALRRDQLTKLLTRESFEREVAWRVNPGTEESAILIYCDIDQLHVVNELWGFETGDRVIALIGEKIRATLPANAVASRLGSDRFGIFLPQHTMQRGHQLADRAREVVASAHLMTNAQPIQISMSCGIAPLQTKVMHLSHDMAAAESACRIAKEKGRNRVEAYRDLDASVIRRRDDILVVGRVRDALDEGRFQIFGQPIASLSNTETARRYEMLVRMIDEDDKLVLPVNFMSSATRYQLLPELDRYVVEHVLEKLKVAAQQPRFKPLQVSINLSGPSIADAKFADWIAARIVDSGVAADLLTFELTETAAAENIDRAVALIDRLGALGCAFALDDFGTGANSLSNLSALNISMLKIDGRFIREVLENKRAESLVRAIAHLAKSMHIETVAKSVESSAICMKLIELGVPSGQGYALGRPALLDRILDPMSSLALAS